MSKGGGSSQQTSTQTPWKPAQPYLTGIMQQGQQLSQQKPSYYNGPLTVGQTPAETQAFGQRQSYNDQVFGNYAAPQFNDYSGAISGMMNGNSDLSNMSSQISPYATSSLVNSFSAPNTSGISGIQTPGQTNTAGQIGQYGFGTTLDANGLAPQFGKAGNLDATAAYQRMLSGTPDYAGAQQAVDAANAPLLRQFNDQIIPGLNQKATFTNNMTGGIKGLNRAVPELGRQMSENSQNIMNQERLRALSAQQDAANAVTQGGFQGYGLGLQTAQGQRGLEQNLANMGLNTDQARAGLMLSDYGTGLSNAQFGLQQQNAMNDVNDRYRADLLNLGSLGGQLSSNAGNQQLQASAQFPSVYNLGRQPGTDALDYANYDRALQEDALTADQTKYNYLRDQPMNQLGWYSSLINGTASPYGSTTSTGPAGSRTAGALGGALAGAQIGNQFGYGGYGALLGGLAGYFG